MKKIKTLYFFLFFTFLSLSFIGCVDEQDDNSAPPNSFLATYDDTIWERSDNFLRLVNDTKNPFETFEVVGDPYNCLDNYQNFTQGPYWFKDLEIVENTMNRLVVNYIDISNPNDQLPQHVEFTVTDNTLNIQWNFSDADEDNWEYMLSDLIFWFYEPNCGW